jgi:hypothetical protein
LGDAKGFDLRLLFAGVLTVAAGVLLCGLTPAQLRALWAAVAQPSQL